MVATRASLLEFHSKRKEDPIKRIQKVDNILDDANIQKLAKIKVLETQFKKTAREWYNEVHDLDMSWTEFQSELIEHFDSSELKLSIITDIISTRERNDQSLVDYVRRRLNSLDVSDQDCLNSKW